MIFGDKFVIFPTKKFGSILILFVFNVILTNLDKILEEITKFFISKNWFWREFLFLFLITDEH
jgi:hypothetical protein